MSTESVLAKISSDNFFLIRAAEATGRRIGEIQWRMEKEAEGEYDKLYLAQAALRLVEEFQENLDFSHPEDANFHNIVMEHLDWFAKRHVEDKMLERH